MTYDFIGILNVYMCNIKFEYEVLAPLVTIWFVYMDESSLLSICLSDETDPLPVTLDDCLA